LAACTDGKTENEQTLHAVAPCEVGWQRANNPLQFRQSRRQKSSRTELPFMQRTRLTALLAPQLKACGRIRVKTRSIAVGARDE